MACSLTNGYIVQKFSRLQVNMSTSVKTVSPGSIVEYMDYTKHALATVINVTGSAKTNHLVKNVH